MTHDELMWMILRCGQAGARNYRWGQTAEMKASARTAAGRRCAEILHWLATRRSEFPGHIVTHILLIQSVLNILEPFALLWFVSAVRADQG